MQTGPIISSVECIGAVRQEPIWNKREPAPSWSSGSRRRPETRPMYYYRNYSGASCTHSADCGRRQMCGQGTCICPVKLGLVGYPECRVRTPATSWLVAFLASLILLNLVGIFLHVVTLREHLSSLPSEGDGAGHLAKRPPGDSAPLAASSRARSTCKRLCSVLLSYKSVFCLVSIVFLAVPLVNRCIYLSVIYSNVEMQMLVISRRSVIALQSTVTFAAMTWSYVVVGEIWVGVASLFDNDRLRWLASPGVTRVRLSFWSVMCLGLIVSYIATVELTVIMLLALIMTMVLAASSLLFAAYVLLPIITARALQLRSAERKKKRKAEAAAPAAGLLPWVHNLSHQDPKSIRKMLQRKRRKRYQPMLDRISEATNSALERSACRSMTVSVGQSSRSSSVFPQGMREEGEEEENRPAWQRQLGPKDAIKKAGTVQPDTTMGDEGLPPPPVIATAEENSERVVALASRIAWTSTQVGLASVLSVLLMVASNSLSIAGNSTGNVKLAAWSTVLYMLGFPGLHTWGNLACLMLISNPARAAMQPVWDAVVWLFDRLTWLLAYVCLGEESGQDEDGDAFEDGDVEEDGDGGAALQA